MAPLLPHPSMVHTQILGTPNRTLLAYIAAEHPDTCKIVKRILDEYKLYEDNDVLVINKFSQNATAYPTNSPIPSLQQSCQGMATRLLHLQVVNLGSLPVVCRQAWGCLGVNWAYDTAMTLL